MIRTPGQGPAQGQGQGSDDTGVAGLAADLTPLLDVLFVLLIFFVLTANAAQVVLDLDLPSKGAKAATAQKEKNKVVVAIYAQDGKWAVDGAQYADWPAARAAIEAARAARPRARFVIAGDRKVSLERFLLTLTFMRGLGLRQTDIIMEQR